MNWTLVKEKTTEGQELTEVGNYLFNSSAKINITKDATYAISDTRTDAANTLVLNNDISLSLKNTTAQDYYGIYVNTTQASTVRSAERDTKLTVNINTDVASLKTYGIYKTGASSAKNFLLGKGNEYFRQTINVSAINKAGAEAYGINSDSNVIFNGKLAAPVTVKSTSKTGTADACGVCSTSTSGRVNFNYGIVANISSTASGASANAYGVKSGTGGISVSSGLAGKVTATATANGANITDNAVAAAFQTTGKFQSSKQITKAITAKATSKNGTAEAYGVNAAGVVTLSFGLDADISATASGATNVNATAMLTGGTASAEDDIMINVTEDLNGKITANATSTNFVADKAASAYGLAAIDTNETPVSGKISVSGNITKDISATATAKTVKVSDEKKSLEAEAYGLYATKAIDVTGTVAKVTANAKSEQDEALASAIFSAGTATLGGITNTLSATATGTKAEAYVVSAGAGGITLNGNVAGKINATASATGTDDEDEANAFGLYSEGAVTVNGKITKAIAAKSTSKGGVAFAYGVGISSKGTTITLNQGVNAAISATASGPIAEAGALYAYTDLLIGGDMAGQVTATATGTDSANADAFASENGNVTFSGKITKAVTAKATSKAGVANASGIKAVKGEVVLQNGLTANLSATASGVDAQAFAISAVNDITVTGDMAGTTKAKNSYSSQKATACKVTATATGTQSANAAVFSSTSGNVTFAGKIAQTITAKATSKEDAANAFGISATAGTVALQKGLNAAVSATATGNGSETSVMNYAYCINGTTGIDVTGDVAGKLNATATGQNSASAYAYGLYSKAVSVSGQITKAITAKATSKQGSTTAEAIHANTTLTLGGIAADISATASGAYALANAVYGEQGVTVNGDVAGKITAKATATGSGKKAAAYGISSIGENGFITVGGDFTNTVTVSATSKTGPAEAYGVQTAGALSLVKNLGTVNVTASGSGTSDVATGWDVKNIVASSGELTGKATVTCKTGTATGLIAGTIMGLINAAYCTLDITVTGKDAYGIKFTGAATPTIQNSKITVKGTNSAYCLYGDDTRQNLTVNNSTLTGDVFMGGMNDNISLTNKSKLVGDVDMGDDGTGSDTKDTIYIHSGSQIKGDIKNTEKLGLYLDDASYANAALWEGDTSEASTSAGDDMTVMLSLNLSLGEDTDHFNLIKNTGATAADWDSFTYQLSLDGGTAVDLTYGQKYTGADSLYDYELKTNKSGNTLILAITEKA